MKIEDLVGEVNDIKIEESQSEIHTVESSSTKSRDIWIEDKRIMIESMINLVAEAKEIEIEESKSEQQSLKNLSNEFIK